MLKFQMFSTIREPAVAGSFYPSDSAKLGSLIDSLLKKSEAINEKNRLKILIVPHAGIEFSGKVAAAGFKQLEGKHYSTVILLGANHQAYHNSIAVYLEGTWKTPLGTTKVDKELSQILTDKQTNIIEDNAPHLKEHSLELELIFLQKVLCDFKIVPILIGQVPEISLKTLAKRISENLDENTLLVISSDLSHYPSWQTANEVDNKTINAILSGKTDSFEKTISEIENKNYPDLATIACGHDPIKVGLMTAENLGITDFEKIMYENSGDVTGNKDSVVGYGAIGTWSTAEINDHYLDKKSQDEALKIARETITKYLSDPNNPNIPNTPNFSALLKPLGAFVTLRKQGKLRGCIGVFEPNDPLYLVIQRMAIAAATEDPRFSPVTADELKDIKVEISIMTPKKKINNWKEIRLGIDGVVVQSGNHSGTFLPQVATETGWNLEEFLSQLCSQKAGLPFDCYKSPNTTLYTFQAEVFEEK